MNEAAEIAAAATAFEARLAAAAGDADATRAVQWDVVELIYAHLRRERSVRAPLDAVYDRTVEALVATLGEDAPVGSVDCDLHETFHNVWKSEFGVRPGNRTRAEALAYLETRTRARAA